MLSKRRLVRPRSDYAARATAPKHYALGTASLGSAGHGPERFTGAAFDANGDVACGNRGTAAAADPDDDGVDAGAVDERDVEGDRAVGRDGEVAVAAVGVLLAHFVDRVAALLAV